MPPDSAAGLLVIGAPIAVIAGHQTASNEQDQIHKPPDSQTSEGEQLPHCGTGVAEAETIDPKTTQEEGVQQRGDEVVSSVFDARYVSAEEFSRSSTLYIIKCSADNLCVVHFLLSLASPPHATMAHLQEGTVVPCMIDGFLTVDELLR